MTQPAAQPAPDPSGADAVAPESIVYEAYPPQLEVEEKTTGAVLVPYTAPASDTPDEVEVSVWPGWRSILATGFLLVCAVIMAVTGAGQALLTSGDFRGVLAVPAFLGLLWYYVAPFVRPTRVRIDGEGIVIKPRTFGFNRPLVSIPWSSISRIALVSRIEGSGKSKYRVTRLKWYAKRGTPGPGENQIELGDVDDDRLAAAIARYRPPSLTVSDDTLFG